MGFVRDVATSAAKIGTFGLAGMLLNKKKKKQPTTPQSSMISSPTTVTPFIGPSRGGY